MSMDGPRLLQSLQALQEEMKAQRATSEQLTKTVITALESIKQPQRETVIFGPVEFTYESNGYPYNWVIASDALSGVNLTVVERGQSYTFTLQPGANILNLTDGAVVTAASAIQVMFVRDIREPQIMSGQKVIATLNGSLPAGTNNIGEVSLSGSNTTSMAIQRVGTANTATQLPSIAIREITLIGLKRNSATVYVGGSDVLHVDAPSTAPTLATSTTGGSLSTATYYVKYTWVTANGETTASPEANIVVPNTTTTNDITVTIPALPNGVTSANVYISTATGTETKQGSTASTTYTQTAALVSGSTLPAFSTSDKYGVALDPKDSETFNFTNADMLYIFGVAGDGVSYVAL